MTGSLGERKVPRYYLNLRYGSAADKLAIDPEGDELAHADLVRDHVLWTARMVMKARTHRVRDWMDCSFEVLDAERNLVLTLPFSDTVSEIGGGERA